MRYTRLYLYFFPVFLFLGIQLDAQDTELDTLNPDRLYLKEGSMMKGKLLHIVQGKEIWFEVSTGDTLVFHPKQVKRVVQDADILGEDFEEIVRHKPYEFQEVGIYFNGMGSIGFGRDFNGNSNGSLGLSLAAGYQLNRWLGLGGGVGMDMYQPADGMIVYPIFAEARGYFNQKKRAPYYAFRLGYGLAFADEGKQILEAKGGVLIHPALGIRWGAAEDLNFVTDIGFQYQRSSFTFESWNGELAQQMGFKRLVIRLGILF